MGIIVYNHRSSKDYHIQVEHPPGYDIPEKDYDVVHVPGRNGDIIIGKGSYKNIKKEYEISFGSLSRKFSYMAREVAEWLSSSSTYARLEDSYEPDYYRLGLFVGPTNIENILDHGGRAKIEFTCKPQHFLKNGDKVILFSSAGSLKNPTNQTSFPIITVRGTGTGTINVNGYPGRISAIDGYITINGEIQDCYKDTLNKNSTVTFEKGYPRLNPGENKISWSGGITSVEVIPKWWKL